MQIELTEQERTLILQMLGQVTLNPLQPDIVEVATLCRGLVGKLGTPETAVSPNPASAPIAKTKAAAAD